MGLAQRGVERLDAYYPAGTLICLLLDNHSAHRSRFSKVARSVLRRIRVASKAELAERIRRYIEICNAAPLLPHWRHGITPDCQAQAA